MCDQHIFLHEQFEPKDRYHKIECFYLDKIVRCDETDHNRFQILSHQHRSLKFFSQFPAALHHKCHGIPSAKEFPQNHHIHLAPDNIYSFLDSHYNMDIILVEEAERTLIIQMNILLEVRVITIYQFKVSMLYLFIACSVFHVHPPELLRNQHRFSHRNSEIASFPIVNFTF